MRTDVGDAPVEAVGCSCAAPGWTEVAPTARTDVLGPDRRLAFPVAYGGALCGRWGPATVVVGFRTGAGTPSCR